MLMGTATETNTEIGVVEAMMLGAATALTCMAFRGDDQPGPMHGTSPIHRSGFDDFRLLTTPVGWLQLDLPL